jgi:hypothetical protein
MNLKRRVISVINYTKFAYFLCKGILGSSSPEVVLKLLSKFLALEAPFYSNKLVMGRSMPKSIELLNSLVTSYLETKSDVTLEQILEVLKREFLKRENKNHGRKQF